MNHWWLIWSNKRGLWWRANERGHTQYIEEAGRYSFEEATRIVNDGRVCGLLSHQRIDPVTEAEYTSFDIYMVQAP